MDPDFFTKTLEGRPAVVVGIDPGETAGVCWFHGSRLISAKQIKGLSVPEVFRGVRAFIHEAHPHIIVMESYRVYSWKAQDHAWQDMFTSRLIGAIECYCADAGIKLVMQTAQVAKKFVTDDKLNAWKLWQVGQRHARDAIRHAVYYLLFEVAKVHNPKGGGTHGQAEKQGS